jgi:hypothetical protein
VSLSLLLSSTFIYLPFAPNIFFFSLSPFLSGTFTVGLFFSFFPVVRRGSPTTHAHLFSSPLSGRHNTNTTTHNIHGREAHPAWDSNPADVALPSTTLTSAPDRHTHIHGPAEVPSFEKSLPFGGIRTHWRRDRDLGALSPTAMRPPSYLLLLLIFPFLHWHTRFSDSISLSLCFFSVLFSFLSSFRLVSCTFPFHRFCLQTLAFSFPLSLSAFSSYILPSLCKPGVSLSTPSTSVKYFSCTFSTSSYSFLFPNLCPAPTSIYSLSCSQTSSFSS